MSSKDILSRSHQLLIACLKFNGILLGIDFLILLSLLVFGQNIEDLDLVNLLSTLLFFETGLLFLIGGVTEVTSTVFFGKIREYVFHSKDEWTIDTYRRGRQRTLQYIIFGVLLFVESIALAFIP